MDRRERRSPPVKPRREVAVTGLARPGPPRGASPGGSGAPRPGPPLGFVSSGAGDDRVAAAPHPAVAAAVQAMVNAAGLSPADQIAQYEAAYETLRETLASIDQS
ncbi:hypothetical protein [Salinispora arenicola]|uniref:Uncharacterized protein n=1 Tax=Salinispora arenicola (strain CNS-205) TaxID=391037 RepID=A8LYS3_SALAI|nr:hypothetical protein [Salinispora arenicola]